MILATLYRTHGTFTFHEDGTYVMADDQFVGYWKIVDEHLMYRGISSVEWQLFYNNTEDDDNFLTELKWSLMLNDLLVEYKDELEQEGIQEHIQEG